MKLLLNLSINTVTNYVQKYMGVNTTTRFAKLKEENKFPDLVWIKYAFPDHRKSSLNFPYSPQNLLFPFDFLYLYEP